LRSSEETWLSTVRTEMNSRAPISALLRCAPTSASTSASRAEISTVAATVPFSRTSQCSGSAVVSVVGTDAGPGTARRRSSQGPIDHR
jgi:hypothetical protein